MKKSHLLLFVLLLLQCISIAQTNQKTVFIFDSKEKLKDVFNLTETDRVIDLKISGILSNREADNLVARFYSFSNKVKNFQIKDINSDNIREATITLDKTARLSFFTKLLINFEVRNVIAGGIEMKTEKLND